jgi:hypothetical protein
MHPPPLGMSETRSEIPPLPWLTRWAVGLCAAAFIALTVWQIVARRDDWPLSSFDMYSGLEGKVSSRSVIKGVSEQGEFALTGEHTSPFGGARLRHLNGKLSGQQKRQRRFIHAVRSRYESRRESQGWPILQGIRSYSEVWNVQPGLLGIDKPKRRLTGSLYIAPATLLAQLESERNGGAPTAARGLPPGNWVGEFAPDHCPSACSDLPDRYASAEHAIVLSTAHGGAAAATLSVPLAKGSWFLFVRSRNTPEASVTRMSVALDGKTVDSKTGIGNPPAELGTGVWIWVSAMPGERPFQLRVAEDGVHTLTFKVKGGAIQLDQLWLSQTQLELPTWSEPVRG